MSIENSSTRTSPPPPITARRRARSACRAGPRPPSSRVRLPSAWLPPRASLESTLRPAEECERCGAKLTEFVRDFRILAAPYWGSEERWPARGLLALVVGAVARAGGPARRAEHLVPASSIDALQNLDQDAFWRLILLLRGARGDVHRRAGLQGVLAADARDPLAPLADRPVRRRLARASALLPAAALRDGHRQPGPAHRRRPAAVRGRTLELSLGLSRRSSRCSRSSGSCGGCRARGRCRRHLVRDPGLHGLGGARLRDRRHLAHASRRAGRWRG